MNASRYRQPIMTTRPRMSTHTLTAIAIRVLEEAQDSCDAAPVQPGLGLRFAVAYLYTVSDDRTHPGATPRQAFEEFLATVSCDKVSENPHRDGRGRWSLSLAALNHIKRRVGYAP